MTTTAHQGWTGAAPLQYDTSIDNVTEELISWLSPGRLAEGKITVIDGDPGGGKSTLCIDWMARLSSGRALPGGGCAQDPCGVMIINGEDDVADTIKPRLRIHGAHMPNCHHLSIKPDGAQFLIPDDLPDLRAICQVHNIRFIVFDPIFMFLKADMMNSQAIKQGLATFKDWVSHAHISCVMLRHFNKNNQSSVAMYRGEGSIGLNALVRFSLAAGQHPTDPNLRVLAPVKGNIGERNSALTYRIDPVVGEQHGLLTWVGEENLIGDELLSGGSKADREDREDIWAWAEAMIGEQGITVKELEKASREMGYRPDTVKDVLRSHGIKSKPKGKGGPGTYMKPSEPRGLDLRCAGCNGIRWKDQDTCPACGTKAVKFTRETE